LLKAHGVEVTKPTVTGDAQAIPQSLQGVIAAH